MRRKSLVAVVAIGLVALASSLLSVTNAQAECKWVEGVCGPGQIKEGSRGGGGTILGDRESLCCTRPETPSEPCATGESASERAARFQKEEAQLKANCEKKGASWQWDAASKQCKQAPCPEGQMRTKASGGNCEKPGVIEGTTTGKKGGFIQIKPNCAEGFVYSESENSCVAAPPAKEQTSDEGKKKKKKKKKHDD
jgi:hypothetical protein